jgi:hypothetical protein
LFKLDFASRIEQRIDSSLSYEGITSRAEAGDFAQTTGLGRRVAAVTEVRQNKLRRLKAQNWVKSRK